MNSYSVLDMEFDKNGRKQVIHPVLLHDALEIILVDCGYPRSVPQIEKAVEKQGFRLEAITKIIVTHHDVDHIGALAELKKRLPRVEIIAYELDKPYIEGSKKLLRLQQAEADFEALPEDAKPERKQFIDNLRRIEPVSVDRTVADNERLPWCGGIQVVHTPGHLPSHMSLYLASSKTLIAGDAVVLLDGRLDLADPRFTMDREQAVRSVQRMADYDIDEIVCFHGGVWKGDVGRELRNLVGRYTA